MECRCVGYVRTIGSTDPFIEIQKKDDRLFIDKVPYKEMNRPELCKMLDFVKEGDTVVVQSLCSLARDTTDLLDIMQKLTDRHVSFRSIQESISYNKQQVATFCAMLEIIDAFKQNSLKLHLHEGHADGKRGRPPIIRPLNWDEVITRWENNVISAEVAQRELGLKPATFYRLLKKARKQVLTEEKQPASEQILVEEKQPALEQILAEEKQPAPEENFFEYDEPDKRKKGRKTRHYK